MNLQTKTPNLRFWCLPLSACALYLTAPAQTAPAPVPPPAAGRTNANGKDAPDVNDRAAKDAKATRAAIQSTGKSAGGADDPIALAPFEVKAEDNGYSATNTMAGTRLNSRIEDLANSISVVTKQQLQDLAAIDINDIFLYEIGTEGTGQFTDLTNDGRGDYDNVAGNPTGANRMRGLSAATIAVGGFTSSSTIPIDSYNIDAVEISRGPNSSLAGLSEGGGTVNLVTSRANLSRSISTVSGQVDSYGGFRTSIDLNRPILENKLAARVSAVHSEKGYVRKPSSDRTDRYTISAAYKPFSKTQINASFERYAEFAQRANSITPRDGVTPWIRAGSPTYDPISRTYQVNGVRSAPITNINQLPPGLSTIGSSNVRVGQYIDQGQIQYMIRGSTPTNTIVGTNSGLTQVVQSTGASAAGPLYKLIGTTDQSFYDWEKINLAASGFAQNKAKIYNVSIDQGILDLPQHRIDVQLAWRREDQDEYRRQHIGQQDGVGTTVVIDATEKLPNGIVNPFLGRPYIGGVQPQAFRRPVFNDNYRAQLAYQLDMRKENNFLHWIGMHRAVGYAEHVTNFENGNGYRYRDFVTSVGPLNPAAATVGGSRVRNESSMYSRYYMGDAVGGNVDYANSGVAVYTGQYAIPVLENATSTGWVTDNATIDERYFAILGQKRKTNTVGFNLQSFWLNDHVITILGRRKDRVYTSQQQGIPNLDDGFPDESLVTNHDRYGVNKKWRSGPTKTKGVVVQPLKSWSFVQPEGRTGLAKVFSEGVQSLRFHYNKSDSFKPVVVAYNVYLQELRNPRGETEEYGLSFNLFDNRFSLRLTHQETVQTDKRGGTGVLGTRAVSIDFDIPGQSRNFDLYTSAISWALQRNPTLSLEEATVQAAKDIGLTPERIAGYNNKTIDDSSNALSRGWELEMQVNPTKHWTMKFTGSKQEAIDSGVSVYIQQYINERLPIWTTIRNPQGNLWWTTADGGDVPSSYYFANVRAPLDLAITTQGKRKPQTREWSFNALTNYSLAGLPTDHKWLRNFDVGGAVRWASKGAVGYLAGSPDSDGVVRTLDGNKPVYDKAQTNLDFMIGYKTRLFNNRISARFQLNIKNLTENGSLRGVAVNPDGQYWQYRIIDPRQFVFTTTFNL